MQTRKAFEKRNGMHCGNVEKIKRFKECDKRNVFSKGYFSCCCYIWIKTLLKIRSNDLKTIWVESFTNRKQTIIKNSTRWCTIEFPAESKMREISVCARVNDTKQIVQLIIITNKHAKASFSSQICVAKIS